jgi:hypothetical protein
MVTTRGVPRAAEPETAPVAFGAETTVPGYDVPPTTEPGIVIAAPPAVSVVPGAST